MVDKKRRHRERNSSAPARDTVAEDRPRQLRKSSSTGSFFINSTVIRPDVDKMITAVATILYSQILEDTEGVPDIPEDSELFAFTEQKYI